MVSDRQVRRLQEYLQRSMSKWAAASSAGMDDGTSRMHRLEMTIQSERFSHWVYHFVFTNSRWETGTVGYSESYKGLSEGLRDAIWELGGVTRIHRTDRLSTPMQKTLTKSRRPTDQHPDRLQHERETTHYLHTQSYRDVRALERLGCFDVVELTFRRNGNHHNRQN